MRTKRRKGSSSNNIRFTGGNPEAGKTRVAGERKQWLRSSESYDKYYDDDDEAAASLTAGSFSDHPVLSSPSSFLLPCFIMNAIAIPLRKSAGINEQPRQQPAAYMWGYDVRG